MRSTRRVACARMAWDGSQAGSHPEWICADGCGLWWTRRPIIPGSVDSARRLWTGLGYLRIRRLGVRVAPGALQQLSAPAIRRCE